MQTPPGSECLVVRYCSPPEGAGPLENLRQTAKVLVLREFISHQLNSRLQYNRFEIVQTAPFARVDSCAQTSRVAEIVRVLSD